MHNTPITQSLPSREQVLLLEEEIATLQRRLDDMGLDGDCAYERAISRLYHAMVEQRRAQLATLRFAPDTLAP